MTKQLFDTAVAFLGRHGTAERQARTFVGKLRRDQSDEAIFSAFLACDKARVVDPIPWINARLIKPKSPSLNEIMDKIGGEPLQ